jgi:hypothetical protein
MYEDPEFKSFYEKLNKEIKNLEAGKSIPATSVVAESVRNIAVAPIESKKRKIKQ